MRIQSKFGEGVLLINVEVAKQGGGGVKIEAVEVYRNCGLGLFD